jgi:predicted RNase H-like HicB family nuclease
MMNLKVKITKDRTTGTYTGQLISLPEVISEGSTIEELKTNIIDALKLILEVKSQLKRPKRRTALSSKKRLPSNVYELSV